MNIRVEEHKEGESIRIVLRGGTIESSLGEDLRVARELLGLQAGASEFSVTLGSFPSNDLEIAVLTRSMFEIMLELATGVDVPPSDVAEGRVLVGRTGPGELPADPLIRIHYGDSAPEDAFVVVPYRRMWFWIDDTDRASKSKFTFLMILFSLAQSGTESAGPLVTVSAGR